MAVQQYFTIRFVGVEGTASVSPPGNPKLWEALQQKLGEIGSYRNQSFILAWESSNKTALNHFSESFFKSTLELKGIFEVKLVEKVRFPLMQVRRVGTEADPLQTLLNDLVKFECARLKLAPPEVHFFREFEFFPKNQPENQSLASEIEALFVTALEGLVALGSKSGVFLAGSEEVRIVKPGPMPKVVSLQKLWPKDSDKIEDFLEKSLQNGTNGLLQKSYLVEEFKPRTRTPFQDLKIEKGDKIFNFISETLPVGAKKLQTHEGSIGPLNFLMSHPVRGDSYSSFEKFRYRIETFAGLADRPLGLVSFRAPSPGPLVVEPVNPVPLVHKMDSIENEIPRICASPGAENFRLVCVGPWDVRNPILWSRLSVFQKKLAKEFSENQILGPWQVEGDQEALTLLVRIWTRLDSSLGWTVENLADWSSFVDFHGWRCRYHKSFYFWVPKSKLNQFVDLSKKCCLHAWNLGYPDAKIGGEIHGLEKGLLGAVTKPKWKINIGPLRPLSLQTEITETLSWTYPELKSPTYGFDRASHFPDEYLQKVSIRDPIEPKWNAQVRQIFSGENFRSVILKGEGPHVIPALRWTSPEGTFAESMGTREGWMSVAPRGAGVAAVESALRWLVSMGAHPSGGEAYIWTSNPGDFENAEEESRSAQMLALLGALDALKSFRFKTIDWNLGGTSFPQMKNEIFVGLRARLPENFSTTFPGFRMVGESLFVVGPKPAFMDAGSRILGHVSRVISNHVSKIFFEDQLEICRILHEQILKGIVTCIRPVNEAGLLATLGEMGLWGEMGAQIRPTLSTIELFSGAPGRFVVGVLPQEAKKFEGLIKSEWIAPVGTTGGEKIMGLNLNKFKSFKMGEVDENNPSS